MAWLRLPALDTPRVGILPLPTLMLLGGLVLGCASRRSRGRWRAWAPGDGGPWSPGGCARACGGWRRS